MGFGAASGAGFSSRSSFIGCEKVSRFADGSTGGFGGGTSFQRRRNSYSFEYTLPVKLARTRM